MDVFLHGLFLSCLLLPAVLGTEECLHGDGRPYLGRKQVAAGGQPCLNWLEVQKSSLSPSSTAAENHSYCRNYDAQLQPWCYVTGKTGDPEMHVCDIRPCQVLDMPRRTATLGEMQDVEGDRKFWKPADLLTSQSGSVTTPPTIGAGQRERGRAKGKNSFETPALDAPSPTPLPGVSQDSEDDKTQVFEPVDLLPSRSEAAAVQPVIGISQRVRVKPKEKKDLGTLGYVLGVLMMVIIIAIGSGIIVGYMYKRGKDLKKQHEQTVYEREMQRITLPLSAFTNPSCEIVDENTIVVHASQTPVEEGQQEGEAPLMGQTGTPGA
ncbi:phosphoinositide-3-kinase-interacting protein 1 isoform X1 [Ambystoma mexicanum]|uniref:phosphoinositide-3-kinase-interacting protein 1 isoform X1 n=1 Tax=Ambystoma mexicanum TaxID=8296 RepID=UPI0037E7E477